MAWFLEDYTNYINTIIQKEGIELKNPIQINTDSLYTSFKYKKKSHTICCGQVSVAFATLHVAYCLFPKKLRRLLFRYTLAAENVLNRRLLSFANNFKAVNKELIKNCWTLQGIANDVYINEILAFLMGHETIHACLNSNSDYKQNLLNDLESSIISEINLQSESISRFKFLQRYSFDMAFSGMTDKQKVEYLCDRISLKYLFSDYINKDLSNQELKQLVEQLLFCIMMQRYPVIVDILRDFWKQRGSIKQQQIIQANIIVRVFSAGLSLQELLPDIQDIDLSGIHSKIEKLTANITKGILFRNSLSTIITAIPDENQSEDIELIEESQNAFKEMANVIQQLIYTK